MTNAGSIRAVVFDMDGTLLDTFPDLAVAANEALAKMGLPTWAPDDMLTHMGRGGRWLIKHIVPAQATAEQRKRTFELWRELYIGNDYAQTAPFPGMRDVIRELRARGMRTAILSNKFDAGVQALAERHFPELFDAVRGDAPPLPRKPDPTACLQMLGALGVQPDEAAYVGDALVDVQTARNAGVMAVGVSWGYDAAAPLPTDKLDFLAHSPSDLLGLTAMKTPKAPTPARPCGA